eukprot:754027-Hanusia_phi.AAC.1
MLCVLEHARSNRFVTVIKFSPDCRWRSGGDCDGCEGGCAQIFAGWVAGGLTCALRHPLCRLLPGHEASQKRRWGRQLDLSLPSGAQVQQALCVRPQGSDLVHSRLCLRMGQAGVMSALPVPVH